MKLNVSALRVALICGSLLLSVSATSAQRPRLSKPRPSKRQTAEPQTQELHTPNLQGTYALTDPAAATRRLLRTG